MTMGSTTRMGYYSQNQTETLDLGGTVLGEMRRLSDPRTSEEELMSVLGLFMLGQGYFDRDIETLSGGERSRLALALLFLRRCNFLVLDEPTNHLDLESRDALVGALAAFDGTLLVVAHDRHLLAEAVDEIWEVSDKGITVYEGGFSEYDAARKAAKVAAKQASAPAAPAPADGKLPAGTGLSRDDLKKLKREQAEQRNALYKLLKPLQAKYEKQERYWKKCWPAMTKWNSSSPTLPSMPTARRPQNCSRNSTNCRSAPRRSLKPLASLKPRSPNWKPSAPHFRSMEATSHEP
jgi:ATP-binding cassette subfamily F protein 3